MIDWHTTHAAVWRSHSEQLRPVAEIDPISLSQLVGIDEQIDKLKANTQAFIDGVAANHALLWGARGTGKSSLVKATLNHFSDAGLRLIDIDKDDLKHLPDIADEIRNQPFSFIIFCDDLSFEAGDHSYKGLKRLMDGSIELPPKNLLVYATSNRRHLVPEYMQDNLETRVTRDEVHYNDNIEEKIALSDRFGLWLSFYSTNMDAYLKIVDSYFEDFNGDRDTLHEAAKFFAATRASHSGRTAKQFHNLYSQKN